MTDTQTFQDRITTGIPAQLPAPRPYEAATSHAPNRNIENLTVKEKKLALKNALRYFPAKHHATLLPEFLEELNIYGRIYMHRFRPQYAMHARPISDYPCKTVFVPSMRCTPDRSATILAKHLKLRRSC